MTAAAVRTRKPRPKPQRRATYHADLGVLYLTVGAEVFGYYVDPLRSDFGRAWQLTKFRSQGPESYAVHLASQGHPASCECRGFLRWGRCKHVEACAALHAAGKLA